jgi:hypothetical protein
MKLRGFDLPDSRLGRRMRVFEVVNFVIGRNPRRARTNSSIMSRSLPTSAAEKTSGDDHEPVLAVGGQYQVSEHCVFDPSSAVIGTCNLFSRAVILLGRSVGHATLQVHPPPASRW